jgi:hypothetical protein
MPRRDFANGCEKVYETGTAITSTGALTAYSGKKTGRSPLDKRVVKEETSENDIWYVAPHNYHMAHTARIARDTHLPTAPRPTGVSWNTTASIQLTES